MSTETTEKWWRGPTVESFDLRPGTGGAFAGRVRSTREIVPGTPALSDEAMGWLAHLNRKVDFGGTWIKSDPPHESWDDRSFTPAGNFPRYDFSWSTWALALMAETTPAWRELYTKILEYMSDRYLEYWALYEWIEHKGDDPMRASYPEAWKAALPPGLEGEYSLPGWAGNGKGNYEYDLDPVRGGGQNLMYKGYLNLSLSLYAYVSGDDKYDKPFDVVYDDDHVFEYDHRGLNELIVRQWREYWPGIACEAGKIFPWCNNLTGTAVHLYDVMHGTSFLHAFHNWKRYARRHYFHADGESDRIDRVSSYYDPGIDFHFDLPERQGSTIYAPVTWHGLGFDRQLFERMYEGMIHHFFREQEDGTAYLAPLPDMDVDANAATGLGAACALELGDYERYSALRGWIEANYEPTWDDEHGEFHFGFGLDERWPRGQYNGWVMPAFALTRPGQWQQLHAAPNTAKFSEPTLAGVDYPTVRVRQAFYDRGARRLNVAVTTADESAAGRPTTLTVLNLIDGASYHVLLDGVAVANAEPTGGRIVVETTVGPHTLVVERV